MIGSYVARNAKLDFLILRHAERCGFIVVELITEPPDYQPSKQKILAERQVNSTTIEFHTKQEYSHNKEHLYKLVLEDGAWKISSKVIVLSDNKSLKADL